MLNDFSLLDLSGSEMLKSPIMCLMATYFLMYSFAILLMFSTILWLKLYFLKVLYFLECFEICHSNV